MHHLGCGRAKNLESKEYPGKIGGTQKICRSRQREERGLGETVDHGDRKTHWGFLRRGRRALLYFRRVDRGDEASLWKDYA